MNILVTGGAGYIGSITCKKLLESGHRVTILDNLERGNMGAVDLLGCPFIEADLRNIDSLQAAFKVDKFDAVIHFAAYAFAGESMENPEMYFNNNVIGSLNLLNVMKDFSVNTIVFSSSCSIYGTPQKLPVDEEAMEHPESVYAETKRIVEKFLKWYSQAYGIKAVALRYFNACGALMDGSMGEYMVPNTHIIPLAIGAALDGNAFTIFGDDYDTPDGTCIRDYIHVEDLANAHVLALEKAKGGYSYYNLGVGKGYSNKEIVNEIKKVTGIDFKVKIGPQRPGDPAMIYGDNRKAKQELGWKPRYGLREIIESAYKWHKEHPRGYE